jgi:predicted transcriptional regulator
MSSVAVKAVLRSGLLDRNTVSELQRWGYLREVDEGVLDSQLQSSEEVVNVLRDALESEDMVEIRDTDLDIMKTWMRDQRKGRLVVHGESIPITFCTLLTGEYAIPWMGENISGLLLDGESHLKLKRKKVYFRDVREVYFGEVKAFMVCLPGLKENDDCD